MDAPQPTSYSQRYRQAAEAAWQKVIRPYLTQHRPELLDHCLYVVGSSVAYGLADQHSDIDTALIVSEEEFAAHGEEWRDWAYQNPEIIAFNARHGVQLNTGAATWRHTGASVLVGEGDDWQAYYEGHHHYVSSLIFIHDPLGYRERIHRALAAMPPGLAETAAARIAPELAGLAAEYQALRAAPRFAGLFAYSTVLRGLPLLFHRAGAPLPFHKWQWPLAQRLGRDTPAILTQFEHMLERQLEGDAPFPDGLVPPGTPPAPWRVPALPVNVSLSREERTQALCSVQWHLEERAAYQMVRAMMRGWWPAALQYLCATRCLLIKGLMLLEMGRIPLGKELPAAWEEVRNVIPGFEACLWPEPHSEPIAKALEAMGLFRARLRGKRALRKLYLDRPLWSPPSYELASILEEP